MGEGEERKADRHVSDSGEKLKKKQPSSLPRNMNPGQNRDNLACWLPVQQKMLVFCCSHYLHFDHMTQLFTATLQLLLPHRSPELWLEV